MTLPGNIKLALELIGIDHASMTIDEAGDELHQYVQSAEAAGKASEDAAKKSTFSWTEFRSAYSTVVELAQFANQVWQETGAVSVQLANDVRSMRDVTGQSAEESSRLIQVLDDYKVSVTDADKATKKLATEGLQFNIETLAKLSDEYLSLGSDIDRTNFLYEKFGKSGDNFAEIMRQGGDAILEANDAISEQLILGDKQLEAAREYERQLDSTNDAIMGLKVAIGNELLPVLTQMLKGIENSITWQEDYNRLLNETIETYGNYGDRANNMRILLLEERDRLRDVDSARWEGLASLYQTNEAVQERIELSEEEKEALDKLSDANKDYLSSIGEITGQIEDYKEKESDLKQEHADLLAEKQKLLDQGWWAESEAVQKVNDKLAENEQKQADNAAAFTEASRIRILGMLEEQLAIDGLDERETDFLLEKGKEWGIYSQEAVDAMRDAMREVEALKSSYDSVPALVETTFRATYETAGYEGYGGGFSYSTGDTQYQQPGNGAQSVGQSQNITPINPMRNSGNADIIEAIYATRIDYYELARIVTSAAQQGMK